MDKKVQVRRAVIPLGPFQGDLGCAFLVLGRRDRRNVSHHEHKYVIPERERKKVHGARVAHPETSIDQRDRTKVTRGSLLDLGRNLDVARSTDGPSACLREFAPGHGGAALANRAVWLLPRSEYNGASQWPLFHSSILIRSGTLFCRF